MNEMNALPPLEYQRHYGRVLGDLNILDVVNDPTAGGVCSVFGLGFPKEGLDVSFRKIGAQPHQRAR